jgi:hypothetical protein
MPRAGPLHELASEGFCAHRRQKPGGDAAAILVVEMSIPSSQRLIGLIPGVYRTIHATKTCKRQEGAIRDPNLGSQCRSEKQLLPKTKRGVQVGDSGNVETGRAFAGQQRSPEH